MNKLNNLFNHFKKGTIAERIRYQFSGLKKWEDMKSGKKSYVIHRLSAKSKIKLYPNSYLSYLILKGDFENNELNLIRKFIQPSDVFLDIGANIGLFSILAEEKKCSTWAIEPTPDTYQRLRENLALNKLKSAQIFNYALSDKNGEAILNISENGMDAWNNISEMEQSEIGFKKVTIKTVTLDYFITEQKIPTEKPVFIKMDVEGWELNVLKGGEKYLTKHSPVLLIEFNDENFSKNNYSGTELISYMNSLGYIFFEFSNEKLVPHSTIPKYEYTNLVAVKDPTILSHRGVL